MIDAYVSRIATQYKTGIAREHSYRGDLQTLLESLNTGVLVTNEPARVACGAPDYILTRNNIPIGYIEAKDIGVSLSKTDASEQMKRYKGSLDNLILTDYCEFWFYRSGEKVDAVTIAEVKDGKIVSIPQAYDRFTNLIQDFCLHIGQTITSAQKLAEMMAGKAKMMQLVIENALKSDNRNEQNSSLHDQMAAFKKILIHDITANEFADIYAQTLAYGMFAARFHDPTLETFTRQEAAELIPRSNPFLRKLFSYIAGVDIDRRIVWIVDALADIFRATDVAVILRNFGEATQTRDPMIHFYETFLAAYNPKLRKSRGVWYTPEPVVNFIVRTVDDILKTEFGLSQGLADTSKTTIEVDTQIEDRRSKTGYKREKQDVHKVQILDPAAGTGTFLAEVVRHIHKKFAGQQGIWSHYVEEHLIPRLHGFEILMASYAMAHLKLELLLQETGYTTESQQRLRVFLTNSLEEAHPDTGTLWASWLSREATEANYIKRDTPVMVVLGNPPYSISSSNKGEWIQSLVADYKHELNEKNINPLSDDYIKFIRYGQYFIEKNGEGILAYISNNSFLNGVIHRQMRKSLVTTFNQIYIIDLHGSSKTHETTPDGEKDDNVFDIQQGVSINIFVKKGRPQGQKQASVYHADIWGERESKYSQLWNNTLYSLEPQEIHYQAPNYYFSEKDYAVKERFDQGFSPVELFTEYSSGIQTEFDAVAIQENAKHSQEVYHTIMTHDVKELLAVFNLADKYSKKMEKAKRDLETHSHRILQISYRPFEQRSVLYTGVSNGLMGRPRGTLTKHFFHGGNIALILKRARLLGKEKLFNHCFISNAMCDKNFLSDQSYCFPIYSYADTSPQQSLYAHHERTPNLNSKVIQKIAECMNLHFTAEKDESDGSFAPIDLIDYMYAVLYSPTYRETYKEFLKSDFPRIPYPKNAETFWKLVFLGGELRQFHLLESAKVEQYITTYPQGGNNTITRKMTQHDYKLREDQQSGRVWINDTQYFDNVPRIAWDLHIGGYQPAQKWLKDRYEKQLNFEEIMHYQKIIVALTETDRIMKEIDGVDFMD